MLKLYLYAVILLWLRLVSAQDEGGNEGGGEKGEYGGEEGEYGGAEGMHTVDVGEDGEWTFSPNSLKVAPGEKVPFEFYGSHHSVAQGSFANPCQPMSSTSFYSGTQSGGEPRTTFTLTVNDTMPIWFYCAVDEHCQSGMIGVINPPTNSSNIWSAYKMAASKQSGSSAPAQVQGGILGMSKESTGYGSSSAAPTPTSSASASSAGSPSAGSASPTSASTAAKSSILTDISVVSILALVMAAIVAQ